MQAMCTTSSVPLGRKNGGNIGLQRLSLRWCGREDSNFHGLSPTATSTLRVYQFRHDRAPGLEPPRRPCFEERKGNSKMAGQEQGQGAASMISAGTLRERNETSLEWRVEPRPVPYPQAVQTMERRVAEIAAGQAPELVWLLEHPPLYTAGTSARPEHLLDSQRFPVFQTGRGGQYTYHGPGQRV